MEIFQLQSSPKPLKTRFCTVQHSYLLELNPIKSSLSRQSILHQLCCQVTEPCHKKKTNNKKTTTNQPLIAFSIKQLKVKWNLHDTAFLLILTVSYFFFQSCLHWHKGYIYSASLVKQCNTQRIFKERSGKRTRWNNMAHIGNLSLIFKFQQKPAGNQEKL